MAWVAATAIEAPEEVTTLEAIEEMILLEATKEANALEATAEETAVLPIGFEGAAEVAGIVFEVTNPGL